MKLLLSLATVALFTSPVQEMEPPEPGAEHEWLQQLVGEWSCRAEASMGPGTEPMVMESRETIRGVGELWILAEGRAELDGDPFTSMMTLGYDPTKKAFVGTWIDSMQTHLWTYRGQLDEARRVLTLEAEGPSFGDPTKTARYRDAIELRSPDHKVLTSSMRGEDGTWTTFLTAEYRREK